MSVINPTSKLEARQFDVAAIGISGACMAHCLVLPFAAASVPMLAGAAHAAWVHWLFVAIAVPLSILALRKMTDASGLKTILWVGAGLGLALLVMGAMGFPSHDWETALTVSGGFVLACVHSINFWQTRVQANANIAAG